MFDTADSLGEMLASINLSASQIAVADLTAPWGLHCSAFAPAFLYVVVDGAFEIKADGLHAVRAVAGDVVMLTRPLAVTLRSDDNAVIVPLNAVWSDRGLPTWSAGSRPDRIVDMRYGGGGAATRQVTIAIELTQQWAIEMMRAMPPLVHIPSARDELDGWLQPLLRSIDRIRPGSIGVTLKAVELVFICALRACLDGDAPLPGWLAALRDPALSRAVLAVQRAPGRSWTVAALAAEARLSRSAFSRRFGEVVSDTPHAYVAGWRMQVAADLLREGRQSAKQVSRELGFSSPSAFGQAFRQRYGVPPAQFQRAAPDQALSAEIRPAAAATMPRA
jgi:AraC-like DNA-binding protein